MEAVDDIIVVGVAIAEIAPQVLDHREASRIYLGVLASPPAYYAVHLGATSDHEFLPIVIRYIRVNVLPVKVLDSVHLEIITPTPRGLLRKVPVGCADHTVAVVYDSANQVTVLLDIYNHALIGQRNSMAVRLRTGHDNDVGNVALNARDDALVDLAQKLLLCHVILADVVLNCRVLIPARKVYVGNKSDDERDLYPGELRQLDGNSDDGVRHLVVQRVD